MPNRIIKESICTSETLAQLTADEERLFYRLIVQADDWGRFDGRPQVVLAACFPLQLDRITSADVEAWLQRLVDVGLIRFYYAEGRRYLEFVTWERHQQKRAKYSKYPHPPSTDGRLHVIDSNCKHVDAIGPENRETRIENRETRNETLIRDTHARANVHATAIEPEAAQNPTWEPPHESAETAAAVKELLKVWAKLDPVSGKAYVGVAKTRGDHIRAALSAGVSVEQLRAVIEEMAASGAAPWDIRKEACRRAGVGQARASPSGHGFDEDALVRALEREVSGR